jgi:hypothetical protein
MDVTLTLAVVVEYREQKSKEKEQTHAQDINIIGIYD